MVLVPRAHLAMQQNQSAMHLSLHGGYSRRSQESSRRVDFSMPGALDAVESANASAVRTKMMNRRLLGTLFLSWACAGYLQAQEAPSTPVQSSAPESDPALAHRTTPTLAPDSPKPATIPLSVPIGTPIQVALDEETRIRKVGQPLTAHIVQPIYAFDKLVIPVGTNVSGEITRIEPISPGKRTLAALDADFTPPHAIDVTFTELDPRRRQAYPDPYRRHPRLRPGDPLPHRRRPKRKERREGRRVRESQRGKGRSQTRMGCRDATSEAARQISQSRALRGRRASRFIRNISTPARFISPNFRSRSISVPSRSRRKWPPHWARRLRPAASFGPCSPLRSIPPALQKARRWKQSFRSRCSTASA